MVTWVGMAGTATRAGVDGTEEIDGLLASRGSDTYCCHGVEGREDAS